MIHKIGKVRLVQFPGESEWTAIINHFGLDIVEEDELEQYIIEQGHSKESEIGILLSLYQAWKEASAA